MSSIICWTLTDGTQTMRAIARETESGTEVRFVCDDQIIETEVYEGPEVFEALEAKREELLNRGWFTVGDRIAW